MFKTNFSGHNKLQGETKTLGGLPQNSPGDTGLGVVAAVVD